MSGISKHFEKAVPICVVLKNRLAPVSPRSDVVNSTRKLNADWTGHCGSSAMSEGVMYYGRPDPIESDVSLPRRPQAGRYLLSNAARGAGEVFTGSLIETEGPPLFGAYNPSTLVTRPVGSMTITFTNSRAAVVDYTINGSTASKQIERISFATTAIAGEYLGSQAGYASCPGTPSIDTFTFGARITIGANSSVRVTLGNSLVGEPLECEWTGGFTQSGAIMTGSGTWICKAAGGQTRMTATWIVDELRILDKAIVMNYRATSVYPTFSTCTERGVFSGVRR